MNKLASYWSVTMYHGPHPEEQKDLSRAVIFVQYKIQVNNSGGGMRVEYPTKISFGMKVVCLRLHEYCALKTCVAALLHSLFRGIDMKITCDG